MASKDPEKRRAYQKAYRARKAREKADEALDDASLTQWPAAFAYNFNTNPSAEVDLTGYAILHPGTTPEVMTQADYGYSGLWSVSVTTPGIMPGEGISTPVGTILSPVTGSASCWIYGETGSLVVTAVENGTTLGSAPVILDGSGWQRVVLNGLAMATGNDPFQLLVQTAGTEAVTFLVDAVQYEPESPANDYFDGSYPGASWEGDADESESVMLYEFPVSSDGSLYLDGSISFVVQGEIFSIGNADPSAGPVVMITGMMDISGTEHEIVPVTTPGRTAIPPAIDTGINGLPWEIAGGGTWTSLVVVSPLSGFDNFAVWETGVDPDPAMSLIGVSNAGTKSGQTSYNRIYGMFTPPLDQVDSAGQNAWNGARYMAAGFRIGSQGVYATATPNGVNLVDVQVEKAPLGMMQPTAYQLPRAISTIVRPTSMNFVTNPGFEAGTANWSAAGSATLAADTTEFVSGTQSLKVTCTSSGQGAEIMVADLIAGDEYCLSAYVFIQSPNIGSLAMTAGGEGTSTGQFEDPYYGGDTVYPGYGQGPYGGVTPSTTAMATGAWTRPYLSFTAGGSSLTVSFEPTLVSGGTGNMVFNIDNVMVSPGQELQDYGDGSTDGWQWELGGTPGLSRSYYYERQQVAARAVESVLEQHIPLGISFYDPEYRIPPAG